VQFQMQIFTPRIWLGAFFYVRKHFYIFGLFFCGPADLFDLFNLAGWQRQICQLTNCRITHQASISSFTFISGMNEICSPTDSMNMYNTSQPSLNFNKIPFVYSFNT
jgi:hypothetical protein